ncbi:MAG: hypothetical protein ACAI35_10105 [Candidatus Methylacidiphilales bacterium]|nr:tetratricopeptide repeat protein [Candidatus Methylacidiphilales bacterium]
MSKTLINIVAVCVIGGCGVAAYFVHTWVERQRWIIRAAVGQQKQALDMADQVHKQNQEQYRIAALSRDALTLYSQADKKSKRMEDTDEAIDLLTRSIRIINKIAGAYQLRARLYVRKGHYEEALSDMKECEALGFGGYSSDGFGQKGRVLFCLGRFDEAAAAFRKAGDTGIHLPYPEDRLKALGYTCMAWCALARANKAAEGEKELNRVIDEMKLAGDLASKHLYVGVVYYLAGRHTLQDFHRNLARMEARTQEETYPAYFYLGEKQLQEGVREAALKSLQSLVDTNLYNLNEFQLAVRELKALSGEKGAAPAVPGSPVPPMPAPSNPPSMPPKPGSLDA